MSKFGGIAFSDDKIATDNVLSDNVSLSDSNASTPSTFASKSCDCSCKCESVRNKTEQRNLS